jgi:ketosteroid isomerase-like protein
MMRPRLYQLIMVSLLGMTVTFAMAKPMPKKPAAGPVPDKAYMQKIWDGWATLNPDNTAMFYASGPHTFYDIAPLKYASWDAYQKGAKNLTANYKSAKFTVNDDAAIHPHGDLVWGTATVNEEMTTTGGKVEMGTFRWTVIWENQGGKWMIVHEHVSAPLG